MYVFGLMAPEKYDKILDAGYEGATAGELVQAAKKSSGGGLIFAGFWVDCDPGLALWPTLCGCGGLREVLGQGEPFTLRGFTAMRCEKCGSTVEYRETA